MSLSCLTNRPEKVETAWARDVDMGGRGVGVLLTGAEKKPGPTRYAGTFSAILTAGSAASSEWMGGTGGG